jgi:3-hydroxyacyl-[acyl-carrier-protein] dehydratase
MDIKDLIPQREPFLFIDTVHKLELESIETSMKFTSDLDFFRGHFPDNPIVPGVILSEHCFQSGAALIAGNSEGGFGNKLAVVSRVNSAKFKTLVKPDETVTTTTVLVERIANAAFLKSIVKNENNKKVLIIEFACTLVEEQ